jgi:hypothetical protein
MPKYTMWTMGGLAPGFGPGFVGGQGALLYVKIQKDGETNRVATYAMFGGGASLGPKGGVSIAQGPQSSSEFESPVEQADLFWGEVKILESGIQLGVVNAGYSDMEWLDGPAKGSKCAGAGFGACVGLSLSIGAASLVHFKFLGWESLTPSPTPKSTPTRQHLPGRYQ